MTASTSTVVRKVALTVVSPRQINLRQLLAAEAFQQALPYESFKLVGQAHTSVDKRPWLTARPLIASGFRATLLP